MSPFLRFNGFLFPLYFVGANRVEVVGMTEWYLLFSSRQVIGACFSKRDNRDGGSGPFLPDTPRLPRGHILTAFFSQGPSVDLCIAVLHSRLNRSSISVLSLSLWVSFKLTHAIFPFVLSEVELFNSALAAAMD